MWPNLMDDIPLDISASGLFLADCNARTVGLCVNHVRPVISCASHSHAESCTVMAASTTSVSASFCLRQKCNRPVTSLPDVYRLFVTRRQPGKTGRRLLRSRRVMCTVPRPLLCARTFHKFWLCALGNWHNAENVK